jgi:hypothetical protein
MPTQQTLPKVTHPGIRTLRPQPANPGREMEPRLAKMVSRPTPQPKTGPKPGRTLVRRAAKRIKRRGQERQAAVPPVGIPLVKHWMPEPEEALEIGIGIVCEARA